MNSTLTRRKFLHSAGILTFGSFLSPYIKLYSNIHRNSDLLLFSRSMLSMGSVLQVTLYGESTSQCNKAMQDVFNEFNLIEKLMSVFDEKSQLSLVNRHSFKREIKVDERIIEVLEQAKYFYKLTNGAFDVTIEPLMELYGFRDDKSLYRFPSDKQIAEILESVGMKNVTVNSKQETVNLNHPRTCLDFGGIAVGYAVDRAVNILKSYGIESAFINHSGDIYALGSPPNEDSWLVGIVDPLQTENIITTVRLKNQALSTSGNYENFVDLDGCRIGHLLNPTTGQTASSMLSGTIIAPTATEADALSTGLFVLGIEQTKNILKNSINLQFIAVIQTETDEEVIKLSS